MGSHLAALRDLWLSRRARSAAHAALHGLLSPPRAGDPLAQVGPLVPAADWTEAYRVGFLTAAITVLARHAGPDLGSEGLGHVQRSVFSALTGVPGEIVSQRLVALSLDQNPDFLDGCADALVFASARIVDLGSAGFAVPGVAGESERLWLHYMGQPRALG